MRATTLSLVLLSLALLSAVNPGASAQTDSIPALPAAGSTPAVLAVPAPPPEVPAAGERFPAPPFSGELDFTPTAVPAVTLPCAGEAPDTLALSSQARPPGVTGRLGFYAAEYDPATLRPLRAVALDAGSVYPLASAFKTTVLHSLLRGVDDGRFRLSDRLSTTGAAQSLGAYSRGSNTLLSLAQHMIHDSQNTAADLLAQQVGLARLQADLEQAGAAQTRIQFTTKAWWSVEAGLVPALFPRGRLLESAAQFSGLPAGDRLNVVRQVLSTVKGVRAERLGEELETYFHGPEYDPDLELYLQNTSTPHEYACLNATLFRSGLSPASGRIFRTVMASGQTRPPLTAPEFRFWGGKPGSGGHLLTLTGYAESSSGRVVAYAYFNDRSEVYDSALMERQMPAADDWIRSQVQAMLAH